MRKVLSAILLSGLVASAISGTVLAEDGYPELQPYEDHIILVSSR